MGRGDGGQAKRSNKLNNFRGCDLILPVISVGHMYFISRNLPICSALYKIHGPAIQPRDNRYSFIIGEQRHDLLLAFAPVKKLNAFNMRILRASKPVPRRRVSYKDITLVTL